MMNVPDHAQDVERVRECCLTTVDQFWNASGPATVFGIFVPSTYIGAHVSAPRHSPSRTACSTVVGC